MSYLYKGIIPTVILFLLISCNTSQKEFSPPVFEKQVKLKHAVIQDTLLISLPREIISFDKYVVINGLADGKYLHVYDKQTGEYLGGYVGRGQGPGEIATWCEYLDYYKKEQKVSLFEINTNRCFIYAVNDDSKDLLTFEQTKSFSSNSTLGNLWSIFLIDENLYLINSRIPPESNKQNLRFSLITETGEKTSEYNRFATDDSWAYVLQRSMSVSPNRRKMAHAIIYGAVLETFEIGDSIRLIQEKLFYPTILEAKQGVSPVPTDETIQGFLDICTSDEYIFSILCGSKISEPNAGFNHISVFNWQGEPVVRFETDIDLWRISYNEDDNMIYAVARTEEYEYILVKFDISGYL